MKYLLVLSLLMLVSGCAVNSIKNTTYLEPGMSTSEVRNVMGDPSSSEFSNGFMVWKYTLQKPWVGFIPHHLAFNENRKLVGWKANMNEYYANQSLWLQSLPKQHNVNIKGNVNHNVDHNVNGTIYVR